jgi:hypothetical protein
MMDIVSVHRAPQGDIRDCQIPYVGQAFKAATTLAQILEHSTAALLLPPSALRQLLY